MRGPAPVWLSPAGDGGAWRLLVAVLHLAAALALLAWHPSLPTLAASAAIGVAAILAWRTSAPAAEALSFDGDRWHLGPHEVQPRVVLDAGPWLLLRLTGDGATRAWLPLSAAVAGAQWPGLCAALVTARRTDRP